MPRCGGTADLPGGSARQWPEQAGSGGRLAERSEHEAVLSAGRRAAVPRIQSNTVRKGAVSFGGAPRDVPVFC